MKLLLLLWIVISGHAWSQSHQFSTENCDLNLESQRKYKAIVDLVDHYRGEVKLRYQEELKLILLDDCRDLHASANLTVQGSTPFLMISPRMITAFSEKALVLVTCHELGHFLGVINPKTAKVRAPIDPRLSLEGEADFFAGICYRNYLVRNGEYEFEKEVASAAREVLILFHSHDTILDPDEIRKKRFKGKKGIDPKHPEPGCRLLSMLNGASDLERPRCWYNPKEEKGIFKASSKIY